MSLRRLEERVVRKLLDYYQLSHLVRVLQQRSWAAQGRGGLLFYHFLEQVPDFPVWMAFSRIPYLHQLTMADWLTRFTTTGAFKEFADQLDQMPEPFAGERPLALVFPLYNMGTGLAVLSNCIRSLGAEHSRIAKMVRGTIYTFEPFKEFLEGLAWSP